MRENESVETAIGHFAIICMAARGEYSPRQGELEKRQTAVIAFFRTGQCLASEEDKHFLSAIHQAVSQVPMAASVAIEAA